MTAAVYRPRIAEFGSPDYVLRALTLAVVTHPRVDRRSVSRRWLGALVLVGITGAGGLGTALVGCLSRHPATVPTFRVVDAHVGREGEGAPREDRLRPAPPSEPPDRTRVEQLGDAQGVLKPFTHVFANLGRKPTGAAAAVSAVAAGDAPPTALPPENRDDEAAEYVSFYNAHLKHLTDLVAAQKTRPKIFVEALAGRQGPEQCCFTHGKVGWGLLVEAIGATNVGSQLLNKATGDVTLKTVIAQNPDVYVMSGRDKPGSAMVPLGYDADPAAVSAALATIEKRPGFAALEAAQHGRVFGLWHLFYNHPYNIVALEYLARFAYPQALADLNPAEIYRTILARFTRIPAEPFLQAATAPALPE